MQHNSLGYYDPSEDIKHLHDEIQTLIEKSMTEKIEQKITGFSVKKEAEEAGQKETIWLEQMGEHIDRPDKLLGETVKIKTPNTEHAVYVTLNDVILNERTEHEKIHPYEIFIQTKDTSHVQWIMILARTLSAIFRKGGDVTFIIEEMKNTHAPNSGYLKKGIWVPSLVADIGYVIEAHLQRIGYIK